MCETTKPGLETETCSRCCGSGNYSYCQMYGTRCFKCAGSGKVYTKRGLAARQYLQDSRSCIAAEVQPGMRYIPEGSKHSFTVVSVQPVESCWYSVNQQTGEKTPGAPTAEIITKSGRSFGVPADSQIQVWRSDEHHAATWAAALEFQSSLNKQGKPYKRQPAGCR